MVQFIQCGFLTLFYSGTECWNHFQRVTPFGYPGITGYVLLPLAFRSLSRPSSPRSSKASTIHLYSLDHIIVSSLPTRPEVSLKAQAPLLSSIAEQAYHGALIVCKDIELLFQAAPFQVRLKSLFPFPRYVKYRLPSCLRISHLHSRHQRACPLVELGLIRVELMTPSLSEKCSNRLSYRPVRNIRLTKKTHLSI